MGGSEIRDPDETGDAERLSAIGNDDDAAAQLAADELDAFAMQDEEDDEGV